MRRGGKGRAAKSDLDEEQDFETPSKSNFLFRDSDDDAEANEDLSLKIVQKAMSRGASGTGGNGQNGVVLMESDVDGGGGGGEDIVTTELVALSSAKKKSKKDKKDKKKKVANEVESVNVVPGGQNAETIALEVGKLSEQDVVDNSDNAVLRRLLRGPRYFDPPDSSWGTCYNCGEEGHSAVNCNSAKRKKPCFICGSFEHGAKQCQKGRDCFICNQSGHLAKDCPKKFKSCSWGSDLCLKCGSHGHVMFSCDNDYSPDDLKEIQCYVCKSFGHLCCANYFGTIPSEVSCYRCGQLGHAGIGCKESHGDTIGERTSSSCFKCGQEGHFARECTSSVKACKESHGYTVGERASSSCFKCGQEGHFARECTSSVKVKKRSRDLSTPKRKASKEKAYTGYKSAPQDLGKARKKKKQQFGEENMGSSSKRHVRGGWIMDDPGDFPRGKTRGWQSPSTPSAQNYRTPDWSSKEYATTPRSPRRFNSAYGRFNSSYGSTSSPYSRTPNLQAPRNSFQHGYSASWFGNPSNGGLRREYSWW